MRHTPTPRPRGGFTLVELLVACALTVLIMAVLATAFQTGLSTFSHLKSTVGLSEQLRSAEAVIRRDLEATHLENSEGLPVRISSGERFTRGYLEAIQGSVPKQNYSATKPFYDMALPPGVATAAYPYLIEGEEDGVTSGRATDHALFFTSKLRGNSAQEVFLGKTPAGFVSDAGLADYAPPGLTATEWAEVGYFLKSSNVMTVSDDPAVLPLKLFTLVRRQKLLATSAASLPLLPAASGRTNPADWWAEFPDVSVATQPRPLPTNPFAGVNDPSTVTDRNNRSYALFTNGSINLPTQTANLNVSAATGVDQGTDILVSNVVSMQIRVATGAAIHSGKFQEQLPNPAVAPFPLPVSGTATAFDTAAPGTTTVRALQIRLRVYDTKNHLTRQMTMTFDL